MSKDNARSIDELFDDYSKNAGWCSSTGGKVEYTKDTLKQQLKELLLSELIGEDESAYSEDRSRFFEHIFHQNNLRSELRTKINSLFKEEQ